MPFAFRSVALTIHSIDQEDRAMLRSNPSACVDARAWGAALVLPLLITLNAWALNAINLLVHSSGNSPLSESPWLPYVKISAARRF